MDERVNRIQECIRKIPFVEEVYSLEQKDLSVVGKVRISFDELPQSLDFEFEIYISYPLRSYDMESIIFKNVDLIKYDHVMGNGAICIHTTHDPNLEKKLKMDFDSLKVWIEKYFIGSDDDAHYEHIIINDKPVNNTHYSYIFTEVDHKFKIGDFGRVNISSLSNGIYKSNPILNHYIQNFIPDSHGTEINCKWSKTYCGYPINASGAFVFIDEPPAKYGRLAYQNWIDLEDNLPQAFLNFLHQFEKNNFKKFKGKLFPIFIGYNINETEIHWQVAMVEIGKFPLHGEPVRIDGKKTGKWISVIDEEQELIWGITRNASYQYFFGRGALSNNLTTKKILVIGVGAVGSIVAKTLVRGGCLNIDLADHDIKEPENICRSEYLFNLGMNDKVEELSRILVAISPFVEVGVADNNYFQTIIKALYDNTSSKKEIEQGLDKYDIIIDCTTDNDLMYVLNSFNLKGDLINLSISNHARELVCAFSPNMYRFVMNQFENVLDNDTEDLYNPTGCWSPTFKASYNDINTYVQMAIKHINLLFDNRLPKNNFVVKTEAEYPYNQKIIEY